MLHELCANHGFTGELVTGANGCDPAGAAIEMMTWSLAIARLNKIHVCCWFLQALLMVQKAAAGPELLCKIKLHGVPLLGHAPCLSSSSIDLLTQVVNWESV